MGMEIQVVSKTWNTIHLTNEDVKKIGEWIKEKEAEDNLPSFDMKRNICAAAFDLYAKGEISFYDNDKYTESDFNTEKVEWSEFEEREPEDILGFDD